MTTDKYMIITTIIMSAYNTKSDEVTTATFSILKDFRIYNFSEL